MVVIRPFLHIKGLHHFSGVLMLDMVASRSITSVLIAQRRLMST